MNWHSKLSASLAMVLVATAAAVPAALGQADYSQDFENVGPVNAGDQGPANLIAEGWIFRNQSDPVDGVAWYPGDGFGGQPFEGAGYLASSSLATDFFGGAMSNWSILPAIANQQAGDAISFWVYGGESIFSDTFLEVRYSPSGGTDTGTGPVDVGDFTDVLYSVELPIASQAYQQVSVVVPGDGRLAVRFSSSFIMTWIGRGAYLSVDSLTVGVIPGPPCGVPIPQAGETVAWTVADSPITICQDLIVPAGGTVNVDPGVQIIFEPGDTLRVDGVLDAMGTPADPIVIDGATGATSGFWVVGDLAISNATLDVHVELAGSGSVFSLSDSTVTGGGVIEHVGGTVSVERCVFDGGRLGDFNTVAASVRLVDTEFTNGGRVKISGLVFVDNVVLNGQPLVIEREDVSQPTLIDNVSVTGVTTGAGLQVRGANYLIGSNVEVQGNLYPLEFFLTGGGLMPGSVLPPSGNTNNYIPAGELATGPHRQWANVGLPYVIEGFPINSGSLTIHPGTVVKGHPGAGSFILGSGVKIQGTREEPIRFEPFSPGGSWFGLKWVDVFNARVRDTVFDRCEIAVQSDGGRLYMENCTVQNCVQGPTSVTGGDIFMRNSRILNNGIGMTTTTTGHLDAESQYSPNIFAGNSLAVDYNNSSSAPEFDLVWWNDPSGPTTPENPGGTGEPVEGLFWAWFSPWLTAPPAQTDDPPRVEMTPIFFTAQVGDKIILRWKATDDSSIVSQRIEFSQHGYTYNTLVNLPPDARTYEFTAPVIPPTNLLEAAAIRIVATDDAGQETWDEVRLLIPYQNDWTPTPQTVTLSDMTPVPGETVEFCWSPGGMADAWIVLEGDDIFDWNGGSTAGCLPIGAGVPWVSTDTARAMIRVTFGAGGREAFWFSDYFPIRPDSRYGDAPPVVTLESPLGGGQYTGGGIVPVRWTASDDEGLRAFHIQASYDGGRTWHFVEKDLPGSAQVFNWRLPASTGIADVRVRVVAVDYRFQNSSDTGGAFEILAGDVGLPGDIDGDGDVDLQDLATLLAAYPTCAGDPGFNPDADFDGSGCVDLSDLATLLANYGAGG